MALSGGLLLHLSLALSGLALVWNSSECPPNTIHNLSCHTDYQHNISCEWRSDHKEECSVQAYNLNNNNRTHIVPYSAKCTLEPTERPGLKTCLLQFSHTHKFKTFHVLQLNLTCVHMRQSLTTHYRPWCHIKLKAPGKPMINGSILSWGAPWTSTLKMWPLEYELQWRPQQQPWTDAQVKLLQSSFEKDGQAELQPNSLLLSHTYSARVRARVITNNDIPSTWSDWSPTASWESTDSRPESGGAWMWTVVAGGATIFTLMLVCVLFKTDKGRWVYMMKIMKGQPLPHPADSILKMHTWMSPSFSSNSYLSFFSPVDIIASVEVRVPDHKNRVEHPLMDISPILHRPHRPCLSSFSNPIYSHLCPAALPEPCSTDSPHPPQVDVEQCMGPEMDLSLFLSMIQQSQGVPVICEYEKVQVGGIEGGQGERVRLHSVDSGVGSGEEVSQESLLLEETIEPPKHIPLHSVGQELHL